jgi:hypothetical protein
MIITVIAIVLQLIGSGHANVQTSVIPAKPNYAPTCHVKASETEWLTRVEYKRTAAYAGFLREFDNLFNSYEVKRARNGALMIRKGNSGSFKFAKKTV